MINISWNDIFHFENRSFINLNSFSLNFLQVNPSNYRVLSPPRRYTKLPGPRSAIIPQLAPLWNLYAPVVTEVHVQRTTLAPFLPVSLLSSMHHGKKNKNDFHDWPPPDSLPGPFLSWLRSQNTQLNFESKSYTLISKCCCVCWMELTGIPFSYLWKQFWVFKMYFPSSRVNVWTLHWTFNIKLEFNLAFNTP